MTLPPGTSPPDFDDEIWMNSSRSWRHRRQGRALPAQLRRQALLADAARGVPTTRRVKLYGLPGGGVSG